MDAMMLVAPLILAGGCLVRGIFGFGDALVAVPILALFFPMDQIVVIMGLIGLVQGGLMIRKGWGDVDWRQVKTLALSAAVGVPAGLLLVGYVSERVVKVALGVLIIAYALRSLLRIPLPTLRDTRLGAVAGVVSGMCGAAYTLSGPPVILYGSASGWSASDFRATLTAYFLILSVMLNIGFVSAGYWTRDALVLSAVAAPGMFLGNMVADWLGPRIDGEAFGRLLDVVLVVLGVMLLV